MNRLAIAIASVGLLGISAPAITAQPGSVLSVSPTPATGLTNTFALDYSGSWRTVYVLFSGGIGISNTCYVWIPWTILS